MGPSGCVLCDYERRLFREEIQAEEWMQHSGVEILVDGCSSFEYRLLEAN